MFATPAGIRRTVGKLYHGEDPDQSEVTSWHGQLLDPMGGAMPLEPFSDRYTGTREHQFDTGEFDKPAGPPPPRPVKKVVTVDVPKPQKGFELDHLDEIEKLVRAQNKD